ncbi:MAG: GntR family transcriptional regulator, partial [Sinomonas sp.]|nr:GntR family transcriptional regulator [Sinomonas sp.]
MTLQEALASGQSGAGFSLADLAYQRLKDKLITLEIRPGEPINDGQLAAELGVGRTPVREALKRLETDHLVVSYPRRGTFATVVDITELAAISEIRQLL